jgi:hypothetical protein
MIDMAPTLLDFFGLPIPDDMQGIPLRETLAADASTREAVLFGVHGGQVNVTDGRYVYMRAPANKENIPLYEYTLMPTHMHHPFDVSELQDIQLAEPFPFTKGCRTIKVPGWGWRNSHQYETLLFDVQTDPGQGTPIQDAAIEATMVEHLLRLMKENDAPPEQFTRLGLEG